MSSLHLLCFHTIIRVSDSISYCGSKALGITGFKVVSYADFSTYAALVYMFYKIFTLIYKLIFTVPLIRESLSSIGWWSITRVSTFNFLNISHSS